MRTTTLTRGRRALVSTLGILALTPGVALAHAEISPLEADPGVEVQFTITSIVERPEATGLNARIDTIVPRDFTFVSCDLPVSWTCTVDTETYAPDVLVVWEPTLAPTPGDVSFAFTAVTPESTGTWQFRTLQLHFDGYTEPWVYDEEPYPAPKVEVGGGETLVNADGSDQDPACFGPDEQPGGYDTHDGSARDEGCVIPSAPQPSETEQPAPTPTESPAPAPVDEQPGPATLPATGAPALLLPLSWSLIALGGALHRRRGTVA